MIHSELEFPRRVAVVQPVADDQDVLLQCLQESTLFQDYQQAFEAATGFPLVLRAAGSFQVPLAGSKHANPFCTLMTQANKTCSACLQFQQRTEEEAMEQSKTLQCDAGLSETVIPVRVGEQVIGYLQTGQVFLSPPSAKRLNGVMSTLRGPGSEAIRRELASAYYDTRSVKPRHYRAIIRLLVIFAEHLATVSNQLLTSRSPLESPWVTKIRQFIADNQSDALHLNDVARVVNMSPFYFCKFFKRETGLTFTKYLARARVEAVKQSLQNVHARVSEVAFAAGFQSLSQFNRVFRRVAGESPTCYRERLHGLTPEPIRAAAKLKLRRAGVG